ncbi:MAG TPA: DUF6569 family protein [bacterium]|nr:DUF6569 family protein [bacterium]
MAPITVGIRRRLIDLLSREVRFGEPISYEGLTLVPVFSTARAPFDYTLLAHAVETGTAVIEEAGNGSVPTLRIVNRGDRPVLLIDGEHLVGVKQNRILNTTILVPAKSSLDIPVSCVEQGRWSAPRGTAKPTSGHLFVAARAAKAEAVTTSVRASGAYRADQGQIWAAVAGGLSALNVASPTSALHDVYEQRSHALGEYLHHLHTKTGQTGVVAAVGGRIMAADLFDRLETLKGLWDRLVSSYAIDAMTRREQGTVSADDAAAFFARINGATITEHAAVGMGTDVRATGDGLVGSALAAENAFIHVALFQTSRDERRPHWVQPPMFSSISERLRRMR